MNIRLPDVHNKVQDYYQRGVGGRARPSEWRGERATSGGGALIMNAIHQIDALRFATGLEVPGSAPSGSTSPDWRRWRT